MTEKLRIGLVGIGAMGRNHARVIQACEDTKLAVVVDPSGDRFRAAGGAPVVNTVEELIAAGVDAAIVATPTAHHLQTGLELADARVPTLVEKPLAEDASLSEKLVIAFEEAGIVNAVGQIERCNPALRALRSRLENGQLGEIYQVATRRQSPLPDRIADVGVVKDLATHDIDLTGWLLHATYDYVSAATAHKSGRDHEDLLSVTAGMSDGTVVNHLVNWLSPVKERVTVVTGERGTYVADTLQGDLTLHENGRVATEWEQVLSFRGVSEGDSIRFAIPKPEPLRVQLDNFRDAVLGNTSDVVTMREGMQTVAVADAVLRSAETRQTVRLER